MQYFSGLRVSREHLYKIDMKDPFLGSFLQARVVKHTLCSCVSVGAQAYFFSYSVSKALRITKFIL